MFCGEEGEGGCESALELQALVKRATLYGGKRTFNEAQGGSHVSWIEGSCGSGRKASVDQY